MNLTDPPKPFTASRNDKSPTRILIEQVLAEQSKKGGATVSAIAKEIGMSNKTVQKVLSALRDAKKIVNINTPFNPIYKLTTDHFSAENKVERHVSRETYNGAELRPFEGRPGAMDAYSLPSLKNGVRMPYNGPRPLLVGNLKDTTNNAR